MKLNLQTTDELSSLLPGGAEEAVVEVAEGATPHAVLAQLGISQDEGFLLVADGAIVPKAERDVLVLTDDATLQILPPLKGG